MVSVVVASNSLRPAAYLLRRTFCNPCLRSPAIPVRHRTLYQSSPPRSPAYSRCGVPSELPCRRNGTLRAACRVFPDRRRSGTARRRNHVLGIIDPQAPAADVERMDAVVTQFAGAPVPEPVPFVMDQVVVIGPLRCRTLPERVVQSEGTGAGCHGRCWAAGCRYQPRANSTRPISPAHAADRLDRPRRAAPLRSELHDALVFPRAASMSCLPGRCGCRASRRKRACRRRRP